MRAKARRVPSSVHAAARRSKAVIVQKLDGVQASDTLDVVVGLGPT
ncbi:MAG: hypothetical protein ACI841_001862 [Planctomycetota bacterium]|jgi:hypothetical protein